MSPYTMNIIWSICLHWHDTRNRNSVNVLPSCDPFRVLICKQQIHSTLAKNYADAIFYQNNFQIYYQNWIYFLYYNWKASFTPKSVIIEGPFDIEKNQTWDDCSYSPLNALLNTNKMLFLCCSHSTVRLKLRTKIKRHKLSSGLV